MTVVQNVELAPDGSPAKGVKVEVRVGGVPAATEAQTGSVVAVAKVVSDATGQWSINLIPNEDLDPIGTWYVFRRTYPAAIGGFKVEQYGVVPPSTSPVSYEQIIVSEPEAPRLTNSELTGHLAHPDPHPQYLTQSEADALYTGGGGGSGGAPSGPAGGDLEGSYPNPTLRATAITARPLNEFATPTGDIAMGGHRLTSIANGASPGDAISVAQLDAHKADPNDPHAAMKYAIMVGGGRRVYVQESPPSGQEGDLWVRKSDSTIHTRSSTAWVAASGGGTTSPSAPTQPTNPTPPQDVDRRADVMAAIDQFFAEYVNSDGWVIAKDEEPNKVTSEGMSYGMTMAVIRGNQALFDKIRDRAQSTLKRSLNGETRGPNLWAWRYQVGTGVIDWNWASDADYDVAVALAAACQKWGRQKDYDHLNALVADLKAYTLNMDEGRAYQTTDAWQQGTTNGHHAVTGGTTWEMNASYLNPLAYRVLKIYTNDPIWDQALNGAYDYLTKATNNAGGLPTTAGLPSDWTDYSTASHDVGPITSGTNGWTYTRSTDYSYDAFRAPLRIYQDALLFNEQRAKTYLSGAIKDWATARWATTNKFVDKVKQSDGTDLSANQKLIFAYAGYFALKTADPASGTAASIKSTWLSDLKKTNTYGTYFTGNPPTASAHPSTYYSNSWMIFNEGMDSGVYAELAQVTGIAGKGAAPTGNTPAPAPTSPTGTQPAGAVALYVDPNSNAAAYAAGLPTGTKKTRFTWLANVPQVFWTGPEWDATASGSTAYMAGAHAAGRVGQVAIYGIPGRDLGGASHGGSAGANEYRTWTNAVLAGIGTKQAIVIIEPDSIAQMYQATQLPPTAPGYKTQADFDARMALINELTVKLRNQCPNAKIYLDAAHSAWFPDPTPLIPGLRAAGAVNCHGVCGNVSNFRPDGEVGPWMNTIIAKLNIPHLGYVYDTGRNGKNPPPDGGDWQNPLQVRFGVQPQYGGTFADPKMHGRLWIKRPGESDGNDPSGGYGPHGGPAAGTWWPEYLWVDGRADNANGDPVGWHPSGGNAGMLQRPPSPGVAL